MEEPSHAIIDLLDAKGSVMPAVKNKPVILPQTKQADDMLTFEHPVNEQIRLYLRLEYLFNKLNRHIDGQAITNSKAAIDALLKIVNVIDRPDLKSKMVQTLTQHATNLRHLEASQKVDHVMLSNILKTLNQHIEYLHQTQGKLGDELRKHEFLNQIRTHLSNPAGACEHALPAYRLWLNKLPETRSQDLKIWSQSFIDLDHIIQMLLNLLRNSSDPKQMVAAKGFYQQPQDAHSPCELLCISMPKHYDLYPEISANKHRIIIRFLQADLYEGNKPQQANENVEFLLTCSRL